MSWEQFVHTGATILYWTMLWVLLSIPAALILYAIARFFPNQPWEAAGSIMRHRPEPTDALIRFKEGKEVARKRLELGTVRILLDRKHARLKRELNQIRATLDRRLQQITLASKSTGSGSLIDLLTGFKADSERALQFDEIEDNLVDKSTERATAKFRAWALIIFALVITVVNSGLLYLFFDEMFAGLTVPYVNIELAIVVAILFPVLEMGGGIGSELAKDKSDSPGTKLIVYSVVTLLAVALGSLEYMIFYQLLAGAFQGQQAFEQNGIAHKLVALVGPSLTAAEAMFGFGIARNLLRLKELGAVKTIKDHVSLAQRFVNGLEGRYDRIEEAAARASQSIDEFAAQVKGRGEAELPAVTLLTEERGKFLQAVDSVNPNRWKRHVEPAQGDIDAVTAYAWFLPIGVVLLVAVFAFVFAPAIRSSGLFASTPATATLLAIGAAFVGLITGGALFDRATSAVEHDASWKDVLSPRDGAFKVVSVFALALLAGGIVWICVSADGLVGLGVAAILLALVAGLCWASSYADLMLRGLAYLGTIVWQGLIWISRTTVRLAWIAILLIVAGLTALALFVLHIAAWPFTLIRSLFDRRAATIEPVPGVQ
jgi:hypothetical protein